MARRRMSAYGTAPMPSGGSGQFPLPPPPDGNPPVRLPIGQVPPQQGLPALAVDEGDDMVSKIMKLLERNGEAPIR